MEPENLKGTNTIISQSHVIHRYPIATYFLSTFIISWGSIFAVLDRHGFPGTPEEIEMLLPWVVMAMLAGPSVTGVSMIFIRHGLTGLQSLFAGLVPRLRNRVRWWAIALLLAPVTITMVLVILSCADRIYMPVIFASEDKVNRVVTAFAYASAAGFFEELGWTAFAVRELKSTHGILGTGVMVGIAWGAWHLLVAVWGSASRDEPIAFSATAFLPQLLFYAMVLPAYRILMIWIYERTSCISAAMVMHASLTASLPLALAPSATGLDLAVAYLVLAVVLWGGIAIATSSGVFCSSRNEQVLALYGLSLCGATSVFPCLASMILSTASRYSNSAGSQPCIIVNTLGAASRAQIDSLLVTHNLLMILFGTALGLGDLKKPSLLLVAFGLIGMGIRAAAMGLLSSIHSREAGKPYIDTFRGVFTSTESLSRLLALGPGIVIAGPTFRLYTLLSIAPCLLEARIKSSSAFANDPSEPWKTILESFGTLMYLQWIFVLSNMQARKLRREIMVVQIKKSI